MPKRSNLKVRREECSYTVEIPKGLVEEFIQKFCGEFTIRSLVDGAGKPNSVDGVVPGKDVFHVTVSVPEAQISDFRTFVSDFAKGKGISSNCDGGK